MTRRTTSFILLALLWRSSDGFAATWTANRTTPSLREIVVLDATGEPGWLWGAEDIAGDGLDTFMPTEQSIDLRSAYASPDGQNLRVRAYVSDPNAVGGNVTVFVFVDKDRDLATGGPARAPEIDAAFTTDPSPGGYDYVVAVRGNGMPVNLWEWRAQQSQYVVLNVPPARFVGEAGKDVDPLRVNGDVHGYTQVTVALDVIGLGEDCDAHFFVRSVNATPGGRGSDLDAGVAGPCIPRDNDKDRIPDVFDTDAQCTADAQCSNRGLCDDGRCVSAVPCAVERDCDQGQECSADGRCVIAPGGMCTDDDACGEGVCTNGRCTACSPGTDACGAERRCSPDGRCVSEDDVLLMPGEKVEGGAFNCTNLGSSASAAWSGLVFLIAARRGLRRRGSR